MSGIAAVSLGGRREAGITLILYFLSRLIASKWSPTGTTYNSIEGRFRIIKEHAKLLKAEIESDEPALATSHDNSAPASSFASNASENTPTKPRGKRVLVANGTPTPKKEKVLSGRVGKNGGTPGKAGKAISTSRDVGETSAMFGMDGTAEISAGNVILGVKEETVSSGNSSYYSGEDVTGDVAIMNIGLAWDDGFLGQQLI